MSPRAAQPAGGVRTSLIVNLPTEDNLPSHHRVIAEYFGRDVRWRRVPQLGEEAGSLAMGVLSSGA